MKNKKMIILPKLYNCKGDLSKQWWIYFSVLNPRTNKMVRFKIYEGLAKFSDFASRTQAANQLIETYRSKLLAGWSPLTDNTRIIYEDNLQYDNIRRIYGNSRASNRNINYWANKYLDTLSGVLDTYGTLPTYRSKLRIFCQWIDSKTDPMTDVTIIDNRMIISFFTWLIDDQKRSAKTIHDYRYILAGLFEYLVKTKIFNANPVHDLPECKRINDHSPTPINTIDIDIFKDELKKDPQLWLAVQFQYYCALRPGRELRFLTVKDIDVTRALVTVRRAQAKTKITRSVVIPAVFLLVLRNEYKITTIPRDYFVFGKDGVPGPEPLGKNNLRFRFNAIRKALNMPMDYKFYSWKHTGAVEASLSGIPDSHIQRQLGHTNLQTTSLYLRKMTGFQSDFLKNQYPEL